MDFPMYFSLIPDPGYNISYLVSRGIDGEWNLFKAVFSTLIGRGPMRLDSYWSRGVFCRKEPVQASKDPTLLAGSISIWHENSWLPCTERSYYRRAYAIKNQRGVLDTRVCSVWHKIAGVATPRNSPRHRGGQLFPRSMKVEK